MATKNISITEEAYKILASLRKREKESFSEVITNNLQKNRLKEIYGILRGKSGEAFEKSVLGDRKKHTEIRKKRHSNLMDVN